MLPTLMIFLVAATLLVVAVFCLMFFSVAFAGPAGATAGGTPENWQPPRDSDDTLVHWAARMAASVTRQRLSLGRSSATAMELAKELYAGTSEAIEQLREEEAQCSARCHEMIGVMAPEALAVADDLRSRLNPAETERIRSRANENAALAKSLSREEYAAAHVTCPLLTSDGTCAAYAFRPLFCRTDCADCQGQEGEPPRRTVSASALARGIERGLTKSLAKAGVDANRYELSSALVVALSAPDVSKRWANGESVFADCEPFCV